MEVASPIPFQRVQTGNKRRFACSPMVDSHRIGMDMGVDDFSMVEENSNFGNLNKRRRFMSTENLESSSPLPVNPFGSRPLSSFTAGASCSGPLGKSKHVQNLLYKIVHTGSFSKKFSIDDFKIILHSHGKTDELVFLIADNRSLCENRKYVEKTTLL